MRRGHVWGPHVMHQWAMNVVGGTQTLELDVECSTDLHPRLHDVRDREELQWMATANRANRLLTVFAFVWVEATGDRRRQEVADQMMEDAGWPLTKFMGQCGECFYYVAAREGEVLNAQDASEPIADEVPRKWFSFFPRRNAGELRTV